MRPLGELRSGSVRGVFSDIDDTLTHDGAVVLEAYGALLRARAAGLRVVLVTGRPAGWAEVLASVWPVDAAIAENGGIAYLKRGRRVERIYFAEGDPLADARRLAELSDDVLRAFPFAKRSDDSTLRITDAAFDIGETQQLAPTEIEAITVVRVPRRYPLEGPLPSDVAARVDASLEEARALGEEHGVDVRTDVVRARSIGYAIVDEARARDVDLVVMGSSSRWRRQSR